MKYLITHFVITTITLILKVIVYAMKHQYINVFVLYSFQQGVAVILHRLSKLQIPTIF